MPLSRLLNLACTITHRTDDGPPDEYGNPTPVESTTTTVCELQQTVASETTIDRDGQAEDRLLILPADVAIDGGDSVTIDGVLYHVDGPPWEARNPRTQIVSHIEARVVRRSA